MSMNESDEMVRQLASAYAAMPQQFEVDADEVRRAVAARRRRSRTAVATTGAVVVAALGGVVLPQLRQLDDWGTRTVASPVVIGSDNALETQASATARDWVEGANVVVVAEVTGERRGTTAGTGDGTGDQFVGRWVTLAVERQVWERAGGPALIAGSTIEVSAPGWLDTADGSTVPLALDGQPRLEPGHAYVVALSAQVCATDTTGTASWSALGSGAVIPADEGVLGFGESEGQIVAGDVDQTAPGSLERQLLGDGTDALASALDAEQADMPAPSPRGETSC